MKKIIISETAKNKIFVESMKMDAERKKSAAEFRKQLALQLKDGNYQYDNESRTITIDGFKYNIDKDYAETADGEPIPLHYTYNTVQKLVADYLGDEVVNDIQNPEEINLDDCIYEINANNKTYGMKKIRLTESALITMIENSVNEILDTFSPAEKGYLARQMRKRGHNDNANALDQQAYDEKDKYYSQDGNQVASDLGAMSDSVQAPITSRMKMSKFRH